MSTARLGMCGVSLYVIGWILAVVSNTLPRWRWCHYTSINVVRVEGLWKYCQGPTAHHMLCTDYKSQGLEPDSYLQSVMGFLVSSITVGFFGCILALVAAKCTVMGEALMTYRFMIISCITFVVPGVLMLISVSWSAYGVANEHWLLDYDVAITCWQGASPYIGWLSAALMIFGGIVLCKMVCTTTSTPREQQRGPTGML